MARRQCALSRHRLAAIFFVLKTGIGWEDLPLDAFGCSYKTCTRRLQEWTELGIWQQIHQLFLAKLRSADQLDWSRVLIDCSPVKAPLGGQKPGRIRPIAAARAVLKGDPLNPSLTKLVFTERLRKGDIVIDFLHVIAIA